MRKSKRTFKLKYKVVIHVLLVSLPCVAAVSAFSFMAARHHVHEMIDSEYMGSLARASRHVLNSLAEIEEDLRFLMSTLPIEDLRRGQADEGHDSPGTGSGKTWKEQLKRVLERAIEAKPRYVRLSFADATGIEVASAAAGDGLPSGDRQGGGRFSSDAAPGPHGTEGMGTTDAKEMRDAGIISHPAAPAWTAGSFAGRSVLRCTVPILSAAGKVIGLLSADVDSEKLLDVRRMFAVFRMKDAARLFVVDQQGRYLHLCAESAGAGNNPKHVGPERALADDYPEMAAMILSERDGEIYSGDKAVFFSNLKISDRLSLVIGIDTSRRVIEAPVREFSGFLIYVIVGTLAMTWVLSAWFTRRVLRSIHAIHDATQRIAAGDLDTVIEVNSNDEIHDLADGFNSMMHSLREKTARLTGLYDLGVHNGKGPAEVADRAVSFIVSTTGREMAMVERMNGDTRSVVSLCRNGEMQRDLTYPLHGSACGEVKRMGSVCRARHALERFPDDALLATHGVNGYVTVPVFSGKGRVRGAVSLMDCRDAEVEEEDVELLQTLSRLIGFEWEREEHINQLKEASLDTVYRLSRAAEYRDEDTGLHLQRLSQYAAAITRAMGLNEKTREAIFYASPMHDVGKIGIPDRILLKAGKLDDEEWAVMKQHPIFGARILEGSRTRFLRLARVIALTHHEKWDGTGYPRGLSGARIPLAGRITAVADVFDALTSARPYKAAFPLDRALAIMREGRGKHFDPRVLDAFFSILDEVVSIKEKYKDQNVGLLHQLANNQG